VAAPKLENTPELENTPAAGMTFGVRAAGSGITGLGL